MKCPECGRDVPEDAKFCPGCGNDLTSAASEQDSEAGAGEQPATPEPPPPAAPGQPQPAEDAAPPPPATPETAETAREGAAKQMAETPAEQAAPQPTPQPTPQPSQQQTPPSVTTATGPQQAPGGEPRETGSTQGPPPVQQTPPATGTQGPQPPEEKKGTNWGAVCAIGCGIMLLLAILAGVGIFLFGRWAQDRVNELPQTVPNVMDTGEQDGGESDGPTIIEPGDEQGNGEGVGPGDSGPGDTGQSDRPGTEDLGELMGRLGEAVEGLGEAMSATNIDGFDPSTVDATMLPTFYGFMVALAEDDPQGMHRWMSPDYKEEWSPDNWTVAPHIEHLSYELQEKTTLDDGTVKFVIEEGVRDNQENIEDVLSWEIHFKKIGDQWYVTHFE